MPQSDNKPEDAAEEVDCRNDKKRSVCESETNIKQDNINKTFDATGKMLFLYIFTSVSINFIKIAVDIMLKALYDIYIYIHTVPTTYIYMCMCVYVHIYKRLINFDFVGTNIGKVT